MQLKDSLQSGCQPSHNLMLIPSIIQKQLINYQCKQINGEDILLE